MEPDLGSATPSASSAEAPISSADTLKASTQKAFEQRDPIDGAQANTQKALEKLDHIGKIVSIIGGAIAVLQLIFGSWNAYVQNTIQQQTLDYNILTTRPWIEVTAEIISDAQIRMTYRNTGKTPTILSEVTYARFFPDPLTGRSYRDKLGFTDQLSLTESTGASVVPLSAQTSSSVPSTPLMESPQSGLSEPKPGHATPPQDPASRSFYFPFDRIQDINGKSGLQQAQISTEFSKHVLYVWGAVLYQDGLGYKHETTFCFEHQQEDNRFVSCSFINALDRKVPDNAICLSPKVDGPPVKEPHPCKISE